MAKALMLDRLPAAEYHADSYPISLSNSIIYELLTRSPRHAWLAHPKLNPEFEPQEDEKFDIGTAAHALLLQGDDVMMVGEWDSWRTKEAKEFRDNARKSGKVPVLADQAKRVRKMVEQARAQIDAGRIGKAWAAGQSEVTIHWTEKGVQSRCRIDRFSPEYGTSFDYKTTDGSASPEQWIRSQMVTLGYDIQAAWYTLAGNALAGDMREFIFCVQETKTGEMSFVSAGPEMQDLALRKVRLACELWNACRETNTWPGYPKQVCWADGPKWSAEAVEAIAFEIDALLRSLGR